MKCPVDGTTLALAERAGVEIDYCPECRGVWLDRGELDRIVERAAVPAQREARHHGDEHHHHGDHHGDRYRDDRYRDDDRYEDDRDRRGRRRGGALGALGGLFGGGEGD